MLTENLVKKLQNIKSEFWLKYWLTCSRFEQSGPTLYRPDDTKKVSMKRTI